MGSRRGNKKNKNNSTANFDLSEDAKKLDILKSPSITRHSQTEDNPSKRLKTDEEFQDECSIQDLVKEINKLAQAYITIKVEVGELKKIVNHQDEEIKDLKNELLIYQEKETKFLKSEPLMNQTEEIQSLRSELLDNQISKASKCVIVKGLEPETLNETSSQLRTTFNKVLTDMSIKSDVTICDIFRIKSKTPSMPSQTKVHEHVKIAFQNNSERSTFMKNLKNLKAYKNLKISMDCPKMLLPQYRLADKKAFEIRAKTPGAKTVLSIKNQKIVIFVQEKGKKIYKEYKESSTEA